MKGKVEHSVGERRENFEERETINIKGEERVEGDIYKINLIEL